MQERKQPSAEHILVGATGLVALVVETALHGTNPGVELPLMVAVANVQGIPITPMLNSIKAALGEFLLDGQS